MLKKKTLDVINHKIYESDRIVNFYRNFYSKLDDCEEYLLNSIKEEVIDKKILDIGVGGGRTTASLIRFSSQYIGIDYSKSMIEVSKKKFPEVLFQVGDARNLNFKNDTFRFVFFSYNGIDYIPHNDRIKALKEIYRVLEPSGIFLFSSHNRNSSIEPFYKFSILNEEYQNAFILSWPFIYLTKLWSHFKLTKKCRDTEDYSIRNDSGHNYSLLTYYLTADKQLEQLKSCGFINTKCYDSNGSEININKRSECIWNYYITMKPTLTK